MMKNTIKAALAYFAIIFGAGFVFGAARVLLLVPRIGPLAGVMLELPVMLLTSWLVCRAIVRHWRVPPEAGSRALMGLSAFLLLMTAEFVLAVTLFSRGPEAFLGDLCTVPGALGLAGQICFGLWPLAQGIVERRLNRV